jgi:hypothetical protein
MSNTRIQEQTLTVGESATSVPFTPTGESVSLTFTATQVGSVASQIRAIVRNAQGQVEASSVLNGTESSRILLIDGTLTVEMSCTLGTAIVTAVESVGGGLLSTDIATDAVTTAKIEDDTVAAADFANGAVTAAKLVVGFEAPTAKLADGAVSSEKLSFATLETAKIDAVGPTNFASGSVNNDKIDDYTIDGEKFWNGTDKVAINKLAPSSLSFGVNPAGLVVTGIADGANVQQSLWEALQQWSGGLTNVLLDPDDSVAPGFPILVTIAGGFYPLGNVIIFTRNPTGGDGDVQITMPSANGGWLGTGAGSDTAILNNVANSVLIAVSHSTSAPVLRAIAWRNVDFF